MNARLSTRVIFTFLVIFQLILSFTAPRGVLAGSPGDLQDRAARQALNTALESPTQASLSVSILSSPWATLKSNDPAGVNNPQVFVVEARVTNTSLDAAENVVVTLNYNDPVNNWVLLPGENPVRTIDTLASGASYYAYWFARYSTVIGASFTYSVSAKADNALLVSTNVNAYETPESGKTVKTRSTISTGSSGITQVSADIIVGVAFTVKVTYDLGANPQHVVFSPVGNTDFKAGSYRLLSSQVRFYNDAGAYQQTVQNELYYPTLDSRADNAEASFTFIALTPTDARLCSYAAVGYSSNDKYDQFYCDASRGTSILIEGSISMELLKHASKLDILQGETIDYSLYFTNTGTLPLSYVWIWDDVDPALVSVIPPITPDPDPDETTEARVAWYRESIPAGGNPGNSETLSFSALVDGNGQDLADGTVLYNVASFGINQGSLPNTAALTSTTTTILHAPIITIAKSDGLTTIQPGNPLTYTLQVVNSGSAVATGLVITDVLPAEVTLAGSPSPAPTYQNGQELAWDNLGDLAAGGGSVTITIPVNVPIKTPDGTVLTDTASVAYQNEAGHIYAEKTAEDTTTVNAPVLTISKSDSPDPVLTGKWITYTLAYANMGDGTATQVTITDTVPAKTTTQSCSGGTCSESGGVVRWELGTLPPGGNGTVQFTVLVDSLLETGDLVENNDYGIVSDQTYYLAGAPITTTVNRNAAYFTGTTYIDANGDGIFDPSEGTISGITVTLSAATVPVINTTNGQFSFRVESEGPVIITASDWTGYFHTTAGTVITNSVLGITQTVNFGYAPTTAPFGVLYGAVFEDENHNSLRDAGELGLANVQVTSNEAVNSPVTTNNYGQYTLRFDASETVTVTETNPTYYLSTTPDVVQTDVITGSSNASPIDFGDFAGIKVTGHVFEDTNVNGQKDLGESGLEGVTITADSAVGLTAANGNYEIFVSLSDSNPVQIVETNPTGYISTNAIPGVWMTKVNENILQITTPISGTIYSNGLFADVQASGVVTITGRVWNDDGAGGGGLANGLLDGAEAGLAGAVISLSSGLTQTTGTDGDFFLYAPANQGVTITEQNPTGYTSTNAIPGTFASKWDNDMLVVSSMAAGSTSGENLFGDVMTSDAAIVTGTVFDDQDEDGLFDDPSEIGFADVTVTMEIESGPAVTVKADVDGNYEFAVAPGVDIIITSSGPGGDYYPTSVESLVLSPPASGVFEGYNFGYSDDDETSVIYGIVFNDANSNGEMDFGEVGLSGAVLWLNETISITTDGGGLIAGTYTFSFPTVKAPEVYRVREVDPDGYRSSTPNDIYPLVHPQIKSYMVNFGDLNNPNISSVYGTVFDDLNNNGIREDHELGMPDVVISMTVGGGGGVITTTTLSYGQFTYGFELNETGYHTVSSQDPVKPGYHSTTPDEVNVYVDLGNSYHVDFGDTKVGYALFGTVFDDDSGEGNQDASELGINGVLISLSNGDLAVTNSNGSYTFALLEPDPDPYSIQVSETDPVGYYSITPNLVTVPVHAARQTYQVDFADSKNPGYTSIYGTVFDDLNVNGALDIEPGLPGITVTISNDVSYDYLTNEWGQYSFVVESTGVYTITETDADGWVSTNAIPGSTALVKVNNNTMLATVESLGVGLGYNQFGDALASQVVAITGAVWNDNGVGGGIRGNGVRDGTEPGLAEAYVLLSSGMSHMTGEDGAFVLYGPPGQAITVTETNPGGYISTASMAGSNASRIDEDHLLVDALSGGSTSTGNLFGDVAYNSVAVVGGIVFRDLDGDGEKGAGETGIADVTITLDGSLTTTTDLNGLYAFIVPTQGVHAVVETDPAGYFSTTPNEIHLDVTFGSDYEVNFGDVSQPFTFSVIYGTVFEDLNSNTAWDLDEPGISDVLITLDGSKTTRTSLYGGYTFSTTVEGAHTIMETDPIGFISTTPNQVVQVVVAGSTYQVDFGDRADCYCTKDTCEEDDTFDLAKPIALGLAGLQTHNFCDDATDWFTFTVEAREIYTITTRATGLRADTYLAIFDQDGNTLLAANDDYEGTIDFSSQLVWEAPADGVYYIRITNQGSLNRCATEYEVWVEYGENPIKILYLPFIINNYSASASSSQPNSDSSVGKSVLIEELQGSGSPITLVQLPLPGPVFDPLGQMAPEGVITHTCPDVYEVDDSWELASPILAGVPQVHSFDSAPSLYAVDKDLVWFETQYGDIITFTTVLTNVQVWLEIFNENGLSVGAANTNQLVWTAPDYGKYYLSASSLSSNFGCSNVAGYILQMEVWSLRRLYLPFLVR